MNIRNEIINITNSINNKSGYSSELLKTYDYGDLDKRDIAYIKRCVFTEIENRFFIDYVISKCSDLELNKLDKIVLEILRMATTEILFMKTADYAVVDEAVELANNLTHYKDYVNAVLREVCRINLDEEDLGDEIKFSINKELLKMLNKSYSKKTVKKLLKSFFYKSDFVIKQNKLKENNLKTNLENQGFVLEEHPFLKDSFIVRNPESIIDTNEFKEGKFIIQDGSCSLCAEVLEPMENSVVLDICAAPGSKSCNIQELTNNQSIIYCNDINNNKIDRIKENVYKCGVENVQYLNFDATILQEDLINKFDRILVDAPCSATGVINKNPEIKLFRTKKDVEDLVETQRRILENCEKYLKKGGILVYSTCSLLKEENEENVDYIENKLNLKREDIDFYGDKNEFIKLMPFQKGTQGFFISKFLKD
ncbi:MULTISPECIES: 16S rRNA (cytosine(967)-C(5))-methyltransferase RsmB [Finegoldia]|nr:MULTISPECIES: 16S rRNA (cytosine(967)-C(5))-methyltransferase RsmB [Finegoldia]MCC3311062.1 16S rRNA (cytosine(967)-C(5))-methyltransferase RsmB [Finegoldia magna]MDU3124490.1 16S rRNA (cytosine(967)-C(5))-methyltransferase RsmB [Finegoldia magna]MDU5200816.1 16S rRNA (cytosine(967)-C(5))-methyltransferase RsmB [Finegoldia magna]MDU5214504.1 16S rRNA (cytosine(967)-C(5))-methyltransferase RsmB [Finegoldia magna]MDU5273876.1 16S rRNA (cytosine(967)-C(5))-methyltransferase RsmB [Finegoldia ma